MSNTSGEMSLYSSYSNLGVNKVNPAFTLDVAGDINFSGKIYQAGAIFSGWNSNANGNYINSNAALRGPASATDALLLYTGSNLAMSFSNATGEASLYSSNNRLGLGTSNPTSVFDVSGDVRAAAGLFAMSNATTSSAAYFQGLRAPSSGTFKVAAGIAGDAIVTGSTWVESLFANSVGMMSRIALTGSSTAVSSNAVQYNGLGASAPAVGGAFAASNLPVLQMNPLLFMPAGDAMTSNVYSVGHSMVAGCAYVDGSLLQANSTRVKTLKVTGRSNCMASNALGAVDAPANFYLPFAGYAPSNTLIDASAGDASLCNLLALGAALVGGGAAINGPMTGNDASMRTVVIRGNTSNFYTNVASTSNTSALYTKPASALPMAGSNYLFVTPYATASNPDPLDAGKRSTLVLDVGGDAAVEGTLGLMSNLYVGGTAFLGPTVNASGSKAAAALLGSTITQLVLDVQGDVVCERNVQANGTLVVNGSTAVNGSLVGNDATMRTVMIRGRTSNFAYSSSNSSTPAIASAWPHAASNPVFLAPFVAAGGSNPYDNLNAAYSTTVLLGVDGDAAIEGTLGLMSNLYVGGAVFVGSNVNGAAPALPNGLIATLTSVVLDCQGDVVFEKGAYVNSNLLVGSNIGVGTPSPQYPVDVQQSIGGISLNCAAKVTASEFAVYSDRRIKADIQYGNVDDYLDAISRLDVCTFSYIDPADKGAGVKTGLIAQDVEAVLPSCVVSVVGYLPNVMQDAAILSTPDRFRLCVQLPPAALSLLATGELAVGTKVKCRYAGAIVLAAVAALDSADGSATLDAQCELPAGASTVFVVGTEVHDFKMLNYEQINTIAIGAIQAQQNAIVALQATVSALQATVAALTPV